MLLPLVITTFVASLGASVAIEIWARRNGWVSKASYRRKKIEQTPLLGGVAVFMAVAAGLLVNGSPLGLAIMAAFAPCLVFGVIDDIVEVGGRWKLAAQILTVALWLALVPKESLITTQLVPHGGLAAALAFAFLIGTINAFNLLDGIDGQVATIGIITWSAIAMVNPDTAVAWVMIAALAGFLLRNLHPARIYLGEVGSSFIGFSLGAMALVNTRGVAGVESFVALVFLFSLPFSDTVAAIIRRTARGQSWFHGDREHIHHRLQKLQFGVWQTVGVTGVLSVGGALTYVLAARSPSAGFQWGVFVLAGLLMSAIFMGILHSEKHFSQRVLGLGRGLLAKHFDSYAQPVLTVAPTRALVIDLLPYFRELQAQGILVLNEFLDDFAHSIMAALPPNRVEFIGSYSVAFFLTDADQWSPEERSRISKRLYDLFIKYHCQRSVADVPEGVTFCGRERVSSLLMLIDESESSAQQRAG